MARELELDARSFPEFLFVSMKLLTAARRRTYSERGNL